VILEYLPLHNCHNTHENEREDSFHLEDDARWDVQVFPPGIGKRHDDHDNQ
jgi:hypothetical protein